MSEDWDADFLALGSETKDETHETLKTATSKEIDNKIQEKRRSHTNPEQETKQLPPWMQKPHDLRHIHPTVALHNEIVQFTQLMQPQEEELKERHRIVELVREVVAETLGQDDYELQVFGSLATGLVLPTSDIDCVVLQKKKKEESSEGKPAAAEDKEQEDEDEDGKENVTPMLHQVAAAIRNRWGSSATEDSMAALSYLEVITNTRVPLVKCTLFQHNVDISFQQPNGPPAAALMNRFMDRLPPLRPLTFVLKYFLQARGLNEPYTGGVGSFVLQLLIIAFLQQRARGLEARGDREYSPRSDANGNLGVLLIAFCEWLGNDLNIITTGLSVRNDGSYFPKGRSDRKELFYDPTRPNSLALENPLDPASYNVAKGSFRFPMVQRSWAWAGKTLMSVTTAPYPPRAPVSLLQMILPVSSEMQSRKATSIPTLETALLAPRGGNQKRGFRPQRGRGSPNKSRRHR